MDTYRKIAAQIAEDIASGRLQPGDRLPPQREFAYERGIAPSTAGRVYAELIRRGVATGEVGRGTFVRAGVPQPKPALAEPTSARIDMEMNYPVLPDQHRLLAPALAVLASRADALNTALRPVSVRGTGPTRAGAAAALACDGWSPDPEALLFAGNGRQALAATFSALVPQGGRIGFEAMTYPVALAIAARLGIDAVPLEIDADGLRPDAMEKAHHEAPLHAVYLQPTLHNPLGMTMTAQRRAELAGLLKRLQGPIAVEDRIYAFLEQAPPPLAAFAPEHTVVIDSLSKRISSGLTLGFLFAPEQYRARLAKALITGAWTPQGFALDVGVRWLSDGTAATLAKAKRADARKRQALARKALDGLDIRANPAAYHLMLDLPAPWRADAYVLAAERQGIAIAPASAFAVSSGHAPNAVRFALAHPGLEELETSLRTLAELARSEIEPAFSGGWIG